jgi:hypothetical protein
VWFLKQSNQPFPLVVKTLGASSVFHMLVLGWLCFGNREKILKVPLVVTMGYRTSKRMELKTGIIAIERATLAPEATKELTKENVTSAVSQKIRGKSLNKKKLVSRAKPKVVPKVVQKKGSPVPVKKIKQESSKKVSDFEPRSTPVRLIEPVVEPLQAPDQVVRAIEIPTEMQLPVGDEEFQVKQEVQRHWRPPQGITKKNDCVIRFFVDNKGKARDLCVQQSSGIRSYDVSAREAVVRSDYAPQLRNRSITLNF